MTTPPFQYPDYRKELGPNSQVANDEWASFEQKRQALFQAAIESAALRQTLDNKRPMTTPAPVTTDTTRAASPLVQPHGMDYQKSTAAGMTPGDYEKLLGAAQFWDIANPESMDPGKLRQEIEQKRALIDRPKEMGLSDVPNALIGYATQVAKGASDVVGNVVGLARKIPFAGETIADMTHSEDARQTLKDLSRSLSAYSESVAASLPQTDQRAYKFLEGAGQLTGALIPSTWMWKAVGAAGNVGVLGTWAGRMSAFERVAIKGATTGYALTRGSDANDKQVEDATTFGAVMGIGGELAAQAMSKYGPTLSAAAAKIKSSFSGLMPERIPTPEVRLGQFGDATPWAPKPAAVEADWAFIHEPGTAVAPSGGPPPEQLAPPGPLGPTGVRGAGSPLGLPASTPPATVAGIAPQQPAIPLGGPTTVEPGQTYTDAEANLIQRLTGVTVQQPKPVTPTPSFVENLMPPTSPVSTKPSPFPEGQFTPAEAATIQRLTGVNVMTPNEPPVTVAARRMAANGMTLRAETAGSAIAKESTIIESPVMPEMASKPVLSDADVAAAAASSNPGGVTIIRNVGDANSVISRASESNVPVAFTPASGGGVHALVGSGVTPEIADQFKRFGVFASQRVTTPSGMEGVVTSVSDAGIATVKRHTSNLQNKVAVNKLSPSRFGVPTIDAPQEWENFRANLLGHVKQQAAEAGMAPVENITDPRVSAVMQHNLEDYFNAKRSSPAERQALQSYFENQWAAEYRNLAPQDFAKSDAMLSESDGAAEARQLADPDPISIDEAAQNKGFLWVTAPGRGGELVDLVGNSGQTFGTDSEAEAFLRTADRELPDLTPVSDVPTNVVQPTLGRSTSGAVETSPRFDERGQEFYDALNGLDELTAGDAGDAGQGPPDRIPPRGAGPYQAALPRDAYNFETLGDQFTKFMQEHPDDYALWHQQYMEGVLRKLRVTRYRALGMEQSLQERGLTLASPFVQMEDLFNRTTRAHNEALPWHDRLGHIMRQAPNRIFRTGDWARVHELTDMNQRLDAWSEIAQRYGWSEATHQNMLKLDDQLSQTIHNFYVMMTNDPQSALTMEREIFQYIPHLRAAQQRFGVSDGYSQLGNVNPIIDHFAEFARQGNTDFRNMDMRDLMYRMVQSYFTKKHLAEPWENMVKTWSDERIPEDVRGEVLGWARMARYGTDMGHSAAVSVLKNVTRSFGVPISNREAVSLLDTPLRWNYQALLGGKPSLLFRDSIQPFKVALKTGPIPVAQTYARLISDPAYRAEAMARGLSEGWIEADRPQFESAGLFENQQGTSGDLTLTDAQAKRREFLARIGDVIKDNTPTGLVEGLEKIRPLRLYAKLSGGINKAIAAETGRNEALNAIAKYRAYEASLAGGPAAEKYTMDDLMNDSTALTFESPIANRFKEMITGGFDEDAANFIARQMADWSQGRYGQKETLPINRNYAGRLFFQFGNFAPQEIESIASMVNNGASPMRKMKMLAGYGAINAALAYAESKTHWGFGKWMWLKGALFGGGPAVEPATVMLQAGAGAMNMAQGQAPSPVETQAIQNVGQMAGSGGGLLSSFFPYQGYLNTAEQIARAMQTGRPLNDALAYIVTGDRVQTSERRDLLAALNGLGTRDRIAGTAVDGTQTPVVPAGSVSPNGAGPSLNYTFGHGVADPTRVYMSPEGYPVYDSVNKSKDGRVPTHRLDIPSGRQPGETWENYEKRVNDTPVSQFSPKDLVASTDWQQLDPEVQVAAAKLMQQAGADGVRLEINETYRPQSRQELLFKFGRSLPGDIKTWTLTSDHTTHRAIDFRVNGDTTGTDPGYMWLQRTAPQFGFKVLGLKDPGHVAIPLPANAPTLGVGRQATSSDLHSLIGRMGNKTQGSGAMQ